MTWSEQEIQYTKCLPSAEPLWNTNILFCDWWPRTPSRCPLPFKQAFSWKKSALLEMQRNCFKVPGRLATDQERLHLQTPSPPFSSTGTIGYWWQPTWLCEYKSLNQCKHCQKPPHTLLHIDEASCKMNAPINSPANKSVTMTMHVPINSNMMTCQVMVEIKVPSRQEHCWTLGPQHHLSQRLAQSLHLQWYTQNAKICGIAGLPHSLHLLR